jgi:type VI secretion system secreted protein Hcp
MALNAVMKFMNSAGGAQIAPGESRLPGKYTGWIELQGWDWEVECESSWTKGGGASVGKPNPGKMTWEHYFDKSSCTLLTFMCTGKAFPAVELNMLKGTGQTSGQKVFFRMLMKGAFITKVSNSATDEGNVVQKVEMVFKDVSFGYSPQKNEDGTLEAEIAFGWDIPSGVVRQTVE